MAKYRGQGGLSTWRYLWVSTALWSRALGILSVCYSPDGNIRQNDRPCLPDAESSNCCGIGWVCSTNNLCVAGPDTVLNQGDPTSFRGTCSDKSWNAEGCPDFCRNGAHSNEIATGVWSCGNNRYCCSGDAGNNTDCCTGDAIFTLEKGANITTIGGAAGSAMSTLASTPSTTIPSTAASTTATTTTTSIETAPTAPTSSSAATTSTPTPSGGLSQGAKIGIGVGVSCAVLLLALVAFLFWRRKRSQSHPVGSKEDYGSPTSNSEVYYPSGNKDNLAQRHMYYQLPLSERERLQRPLVEMSHDENSKQPLVELDVDRVPVELDHSTRREC